LKVRDFIKKGEIETSEDFRLQNEALAYRVAKHYGVSLLEVCSMPPDIFKQSLIWALAIEEEEAEDRNREQQKAKSNGNETVNLDYSFLDREDF